MLIIENTEGEYVAAHQILKRYHTEEAQNGFSIAEECNNVIMESRYFIM